MAAYNDHYPLIIDPVVKLDYSTYLGGTEGWNDIAVDTSGCAYVSGQTCSPDFPTENAYNSTYAGGCDAFVTKL